jgi:anti-anti-sigma factor
MKELPIKKCGKFTVLKTGNDVTLCSDAPRMRAALEVLFENHVLFICVDMSRAAIIDSSVLGAVVEYHNKVAKLGGELVIMNARSLVLEALVRTQLHRVVRFVESESQLNNG